MAKQRRSVKPITQQVKEKSSDISSAEKEFIASAKHNQPINKEEVGEIEKVGKYQFSLFPSQMDRVVEAMKKPGAKRYNIENKKSKFVRVAIELLLEKIEEG